MEFWILLIYGFLFIGLMILFSVLGKNNKKKK